MNVNAHSAIVKSSNHSLDFFQYMLLKMFTDSAVVQPAMETCSVFRNGPTQSILCLQSEETLSCTLFPIYFGIFRVKM